MSGSATLAPGWERNLSTSIRPSTPPTNRWRNNRAPSAWDDLYKAIPANGRWYQVLIDEYARAGTKTARKALVKATRDAMAVRARDAGDQVVVTHRLNVGIWVAREARP